MSRGRQAASSSSEGVKIGKDLLSQVVSAIESRDMSAALERLDDFKVHAAMYFNAIDVSSEFRADELRLSREAAERGVMISAATKDEASFERHAAQAKAAYEACERFPDGMIERSANEPLIVGLNLLRLLVQNRIAEFHTELEITNAETLADGRVQAVLELERFLMEGAYNKIAANRGALPDPSYEHFMSMLMDTVRDEIASCAQSAYARLSRDDATRLLGFSSASEFEVYARSREWTIDGNGTVIFNEEIAQASAKDIPSASLISQTLLYAKELERIV